MWLLKFVGDYPLFFYYSFRSDPGSRAMRGRGLSHCLVILLVINTKCGLTQKHKRMYIVIRSDNDAGLLFPEPHTYTGSRV